MDRALAESGRNIPLTHRMPDLSWGPMDVVKGLAKSIGSGPGPFKTFKVAADVFPLLELPNHKLKRGFDTARDFTVFLKFPADIHPLYTSFCDIPSILSSFYSKSITVIKNKRFEIDDDFLKLVDRTLKVVCNSFEMLISVLLISRLIGYGAYPRKLRLLDFTSTCIYFYTDAKEAWENAPWTDEGSNYQKYQTQEEAHKIYLRDNDQLEATRDNQHPIVAKKDEEAFLFENDPKSLFAEKMARVAKGFLSIASMAASFYVSSNVLLTMSVASVALHFIAEGIKSVSAREIFARRVIEFIPVAT